MIQKRTLGRRLVGLVAVTFLVAACEDEYEGAIHRYESEFGVHGAHDRLLAEAQTGDGRALFIYYRFLLKRLPVVPGAEFEAWPYRSDEGLLSILNCSAIAGFPDAVSRARGALVGKLEEKEIDACFREQSSQGRLLWTSCGGADLLPKCPLASGPS